MSAPGLLSPEATFEAMIARCRRRAGLVLFVRYSIVACAITLGVASAIRFVQPERASATTVNGLAVLLGMVLGATAVARRHPTPREVASTIDRHLHIDDSVVAALQTRGAQASVGPLIVTQAVYRTAGLNARDVFPMELRRPAAMLGAALLLVGATLPRNVSEPNTSGAGRSIAASGGDTGVAAGKQGQQSPNASSSQSRDNAARGPSSGAASAKPQTSEAEASDARARPASSSGLDDSSQPAQNGGAGTAASQSRQAATRDTPGETSAGVSEGRDGTGNARSATRGDSGGSGGAGTGSARGAGAGGVRGGQLLTSSRHSAARTSSQQPAARYGQAQRDAEAALTRGDIPPELRSYVREYFRAITR